MNKQHDGTNLWGSQTAAWLIESTISNVYYRCFFQLVTMTLEMRHIGSDISTYDNNGATLDSTSLAVRVNHGACRTFWVDSQCQFSVPFFIQLLDLMTVLCFVSLSLT
jgi:hypothetical protein